MIEGVAIKSLVRHIDERGFFQELMRANDDSFKEGFGQLSYSFVHHGIIKAWHAHKVQSQWTCMLSGTAKVALHDYRKESKTFGVTQEFFVGDNHQPLIYKFPPGVAHGYKCINGPMLVVYITSGIYDPLDEVRIAHNDSNIGYDWVKGPVIK
jgi:dTDP-4-dehydrorhamnose 3,5-epimerase